MTAFTYARLVDAVPNVANAADRNARFPSPDKYQKLYRIDTGDIEIWTGASWVVIFDGAIAALISTGTGSPEGVVTASIGSLYLQSNGSGGEVVWFKNSGSGNTGWRLLQSSLGLVNVRDFGAPGDGTDQTAAFNTAIAACSAGDTLYVPAGDYLLDPLTAISTQVHLTLASGATIEQKSATNERGVFNWQGSLSATTTTLAGTVVPGQAFATLTSVSGFAVGNICKIEDASQAASEFAYEFVRIFAISGTTVYFTSATELPFTYPASASGTFTKVNAIEGVRIRGGTWDGGGFGGTNVSLLRMEYCFDCDVDDVHITNWRFIGLHLAYCKYIRVTNPRLTNAAGDLSVASPPDAGYGIGLQLSSSHLIVTNVMAWRCRHAVNIGEGSHTITLNGGDVSGCYGAGVLTHFRRARIVEFNGVTISGVGYASSASLTLPSTQQGVSGGTTSAVTTYDTLVLMKGIKVQQGRGDAIQFTANTLNNTKLVVQGAIIEDCHPATGLNGADVFLFRLRHASLSGITINRTDTVAHAGFRIQSCEDISLTNCDVVFTATQSGGGQQLYYLIDSKRVTLDNCRGTLDGAGQVFRIDATAPGDADRTTFIGCTATISGGATALLVDADATNTEQIANSWNSVAATPATLLGGLVAGGALTGTTLTLTDAVSRLHPGATSFAIRDNADAANNIVVTDAGDTTVRGSVLATTLQGSAGTVTSGLSALAGSATLLANAATSQAKQVSFQTAGVLRWITRSSATAESGSDAGSNYEIVARTDAGGAIDTPVAIARATGGNITLTRPLVGLTATANTASTVMASTAYVDRATTHTGTTSAAPTGTTSATAVMMGLAGSITPTRGTKIIFMASGQMSNNTVLDGETVDLRFGTGTAPVNGAAVTGTLVGIAQTATALVAADRSGFALMGKVTGLSVGTAYWFDVSLLAITGGTATVTGVSLTAFEVP